MNLKYTQRALTYNFISVCVSVLSLIMRFDCFSITSSKCTATVALSFPTSLEREPKFITQILRGKFDELASRGTRKSRHRRICKKEHQGDTNQRSLEVKSLSVLTQQHHIPLEVIQAAVLMAADPLLVDGERRESDVDWHEKNQRKKKKTSGRIP